MPRSSYKQTSQVMNEFSASLGRPVTVLMMRFVTGNPKQRTNTLVKMSDEQISKALAALADGSFTTSDPTLSLLLEAYYQDSPPTSQPSGTEQSSGSVAITQVTVPPGPLTATAHAFSEAVKKVGGTVIQALSHDSPEDSAAVELPEEPSASGADTPSATPPDEPSGTEESTDVSVTTSPPQEVSNMEYPVPATSEVPLHQIGELKFHAASQVTPVEAEAIVCWIFSLRRLQYVPHASIRPYDPNAYKYWLANPPEDFSLELVEPYSEMYLDYSGSSIVYSSLIEGDEDISMRAATYENLGTFEKDVPFCSYSMRQALLELTKHAGASFSNDRHAMSNLSSVFLSASGNMSAWFDDAVRQGRKTKATLKQLKGAAFARTERLRQRRSEELVMQTNQTKAADQAEAEGLDEIEPILQSARVAAVKVLKRDPQYYSGHMQEWFEEVGKVPNTKPLTPSDMGFLMDAVKTITGKV